MTDDNTEARAEAQTILDELDDDSIWRLADYDYSDGMDTTPTLSVELEYTPDSLDTGALDREKSIEDQRLKTVKEAIADLEQEHDEGAPVSAIVNKCWDEEGIERPNAEHAINRLKQTGEVYEPRTDHLRRT